MLLLLLLPVWWTCTVTTSFALGGEDNSTWYVEGLPLSTTAARSVDKVISRSTFLTEEVRDESGEEKEEESTKNSLVAASSAGDAAV